MLIKNKSLDHPSQLIVEVCGFCATPTVNHSHEGDVSYHLNVARNWTKGSAQNNNFKKGVIWVSSTAWNELAEELMALNIGKGTHMTLRGHARPNEWQDSKGNWHSDLELTALISVEIHRLVPHAAPKTASKRPVDERPSSDSCVVVDDTLADVPF